MTDKTTNFLAAEIQGDRIDDSQQLTTINNKRVQPAVGIENRCGELTCVPSKSSDRAAARTFKGFGYDRPNPTPERFAKAQKFWAKLQERRKDQTLCGRCGGPRGEHFRTCDECREKVRKLKLKAKGLAVKHGKYGISIEELAGMVLQMRREVNKMQTRFKLWQKAVNYRKDLKYRTNAMRKKYFKPVETPEAMDYLSQTNHAYEKE